jgi:hypothetical protein
MARPAAHAAAAALARLTPPGRQLIQGAAGPEGVPGSSEPRPALAQLCRRPARRPGPHQRRAGAARRAVCELAGLRPQQVPHIAHNPAPCIRSSHTSARCARAPQHTLLPPFHPSPFHPAGGAARSILAPFAVSLSPSRLIEFALHARGGRSEVVRMHRERPPWFIYPSLYVKALA